jgi:hypothetical protein
MRTFSETAAVIAFSYMALRSRAFAVSSGR